MASKGLREISNQVTQRFERAITLEFIIETAIIFIHCCGFVIYCQLNIES